ncbi:MAG: glycoside hydrolase, partial [Sphingobacteriaceae bacterium]
MKKLLFMLITAGLFAAGQASAQQNIKFKPDGKLLAAIPQEFKLAASQYKLLGSRLQPGRFPKSYYTKNDSLETSNSGWWCSGFYPGTLLYLYKQTKDAELLQLADKSLAGLTKEQFNTTTHDLGFMMFCSFGNALAIAPDSAYKDILINSAKSLSTRFSPVTGTIKSWNGKEDDYLVIIDNMMNLELLFWATRVTGDSSFYKIAVTHANTTIKNHFRPDNSSYHVINYNNKTGQVQEKKTAQGFANESAWARGQAWGLYGYTVMYRETKDKKYLNQAEKIAGFILNHPNLPADKVPYWDFNAPNIPNALRDASAAAITASALLELCKYAPSDEAKKYFTAAELMLKSLSSSKYKAAAGKNGGFILMHGVGHFPAGTEVDVPLTYADYYYIEALGRYQAMAKGK